MKREYLAPLGILALFGAFLIMGMPLLIMGMLLKVGVAGVLLIGGIIAVLAGLAP